MSNNGGFTLSDGIGFGLLTLANGVNDRARRAFEEGADEVVSYAKATAPWEDRTGDAREGLNADVYETTEGVVLDLFHTVDYGLWLETIQSGRFAVIMPTLEVYASRLFDLAGGRIGSIEEGGD
jgi:hypothetical protein